MKIITHRKRYYLFLNYPSTKYSMDYKQINLEMTSKFLDYALLKMIDIKQLSYYHYYINATVKLPLTATSSSSIGISSLGVCNNCLYVDLIEVVTNGI